jgi:AcrR family transcriptional regulator
MTFADLIEKYATILALRARREEAPEAPPPREELRALAERFPGALRELERLPPETVRRRMAELDQALRAGEEPPTWAFAQRSYHVALREALDARARRRDPERAWAAPGPADPGRGPMVTWAIERAATELGLTTGGCRALVFPWEA